LFIACLSDGDFASAPWWNYLKFSIPCLFQRRFQLCDQGSDILTGEGERRSTSSLTWKVQSSILDRSCYRLNFQRYELQRLGNIQEVLGSSAGYGRWSKRTTWMPNHQLLLSKRRLQSSQLGSRKSSVLIGFLDRSPHKVILFCLLTCSCRFVFLAVWFISVWSMQRMFSKK
jgi:hypothetical protein